MEMARSEKEKLTLLIVDDEQYNLETLSIILKSEGYSPITAGGGKECLNILSTTDVDLVLLDIFMPDLDGFETLQRIRSQKKTKELPVIFLSGNVRDPVSIDRGFSLGVNEYLLKPIETKELLVRVRSILRMTQAEKKLKQLQSDFISMLVHDLRGPLTAISAFTQLLKDEEYDVPTRNELLAMMGSSCEHMLSIVNDILDLSSLESDYVQLEMVDVDMQSIINESIAHLKPLAAKKSILLRVDIQPQIPSLLVDVQKIQQVMENLVGNAIKFTQDGGAVTVTLSVLNSLPQGSTPADLTLPSLLISVKDTGIGVPPDDMAYLFDKYRQVRTTKINVDKGSGLGLAICKNIVEAHGGIIWAESREGTGSAFYFTLPMKAQKTP